MNEIIALQKYENEAQLAKELIRGFEDLETFKKQYGIQDQITKEY